MNSVSGLYQCQCPGCDIILEFCKVLRETELKILAVLFIIVLCIMDTLKFFFHLFLLVGG